MLLRCLGHLGDCAMPVLQLPDTFVEIEDVGIKNLDAVVEALDAGIQVIDAVLRGNIRSYDTMGLVHKH